MNERKFRRAGDSSHKSRQICLTPRPNDGAVDKLRNIASRGSRGVPRRVSSIAPVHNDVAHPAGDDISLTTMRWDNLFDDLESQLEQELTAEEVDLRAEEERLRLARLGIRDRLRSLHSHDGDPGTRPLRLLLSDGSRVAIHPATFGRDWLAGELVEESGRRPQCILPLDAIDGVILDRPQVSISLEPLAEESSGALSARLGLTFVLRDLCRRRAAVSVRLRGQRLHGTIDRVGRDHFDLAEHEPNQPRRDSLVNEYRIVRLTDLVLLRL